MMGTGDIQKRILDAFPGLEVGITPGQSTVILLFLRGVPAVDYKELEGLDDNELERLIASRLVASAYLGNNSSHRRRA